MSQTIPAQSRQTLLVADHSKLRRGAPVRIASLGEIGAFVTDRPLPPALAQRGRDWGTQGVVTGPDGGGANGP